MIKSSSSPALVQCSSGKVPRAGRNRTRPNLTEPPPPEIPPQPESPIIEELRKRLDEYAAEPNLRVVEEGEPLRKLQGLSFLEYSQQTINSADTLLGDRFLCVGGAVVLVGPSGQGKSVMGAQFAIEWGCGRRSFGIPTPRPMRSLLIQAEDDHGDLIEMSRIVDHLKLSENERRLVKENTCVEFLNDKTGMGFISVADSFLSQRQFDLVWINPYSTYLGNDVKDDQATAEFLIKGINPMLTKRHVGAILIHHTPKTNFRDTSGWRASDWQYAGAGAARLTNWARGYIVMEPTEDLGVYKLIAAKRGNRIGWGSLTETYWAHSRQPGQLLWVPADSDQIASAKKPSSKTPDDLLELVPMLDPELKETLCQQASEKKGIGINKARDFLKILVHQQKIYEHKIPHYGARPAIAYAKTPPADP